MAEQNLRRALIISHGDPLIFVQRPICLVLILVALFMMVSSYYRIKKTMGQE